MAVPDPSQGGCCLALKIINPVVRSTLLSQSTVQCLNDPLAIEGSSGEQPLPRSDTQALVAKWDFTLPREGLRA